MPEDSGTLLDWALCQTQDVYALSHGNKAPSGQHDQLIICLINQFSELAEGKELTNRCLEHKERTERYPGGRKYIVVKAGNIEEEAPFGVWDSPDRVFDDTTKLTVGTDVFVRPENGRVERVGQRFCPGSQSTCIIYTGGIVKPRIAGIRELPEVPHDLRVAAAMQVSVWFKNRDDLGMQAVNVTGAGGTTMGLPPTHILPAVKKTLMKYRRFD